MRSIPVNPIFLLILIHAWARVKKMPMEGMPDAAIDAGLSGWPEAVATPRAFRRWLDPLLRAETLTVDPESLEKSLSSPILRSMDRARCPAHLSRVWGSEKAPVVDIPGGFDFAPGSDLLAIGLNWRPQWAESLPAEALDLLTLAHDNNIQVWVHVPPSSDLVLSEDTLRRSTQVGWSWWFQPPAKSDELEAWFNQYRPAWGFWLCSPVSDQWAWPWMDIFSRCLVSRMGAKAFDRTWQRDARQKTAWNRVEEQAWKRACEVLGGEDVAMELSARTLLSLVTTQPGLR